MNGVCGRVCAILSFQFLLNSPMAGVLQHLHELLPRLLKVATWEVDWTEINTNKATCIYMYSVYIYIYI